MAESDRNILGMERERVLAFRRDLAAQIAIEAEAFSAEGRSLTYEAPVAMPLAVGSFATLTTPEGARYLGQVLSRELTVREGPAIEIDLGTDLGAYAAGATLKSAEIRPTARAVAGEGVLLCRLVEDGTEETSVEDAFRTAEIEPAPRGAVEQYLRSKAGSGASLDVGRLALGAEGPRVALRADGFNRHTFFCGQSGSGKTYSLGLVLERLLMHTGLRIVILDPNSDFVRLGEIHPRAEVRSTRGAPAYRDLVARHRAAVAGLRVLRGASVEPSRTDVLRVGFGDLTGEEQGAVLRLDPLADREEYNAFWHMAGSLGRDRYTLADVKETASRLLTDEARQVALRIENLDVGKWEIWAGEQDHSLADLLADDDWRATVVDIGTLASGREKSVAAVATLSHFWRHREERRPVLLVIDEAHNVCPAEPAGALQSLGTELVVTIAGEGRKYGLYLLVSTQRPEKIHPNVLSQCDNLVLMRMNSSGDLAEIEEVFSFVPRPIIEEATRFAMGECLLAGRIVPTPLRARLEGRITREGGTDVPATWAGSP